nr:hypothetical protein [Tanacetum cinerariifolium]
MALAFADTHNMIVFLTKSDASEGFDQIVDFLNAHVIQYALMVNPTIYVSCIKQFWTSVSIKKVNDVVRLQALIDQKKVIITEDSIRQALRLDDADGVDCLPNEEIFVELARIGYEKPSTKLTFYKAFFLAQWKFLIHTILQCMSAKRTAWNEFSSSMASAVICLATVSAEPTLPSPTPATPPPSPTQAHIPLPPQAKTAQPSSLPQQPSQTAKISMTLLNTLLETCATLTKQVANLELDKVAQAIEITKLTQRVRRLEKKRQFKTSGLKRLRKVGTAQRVESSADTGRLAESQAKVYHLDVEHTEKVCSMQYTDKVEPGEVEEASAIRRRKGVVIHDPEETATASVIVHSEAKSKDKGKGILIKEPKPLKRQAQTEQDEAFARQLEAELNAIINWNDVVDQVKRKEKQDNTVMRYQALKRKRVIEAQARKNMMVYLKNMAGFKMDFFKGMTYTDIRPIFEKHYNSIQAFLKKGEEEITEQEKGSKRKDASHEQRATKK